MNKIDNLKPIVNRLPVDSVEEVLVKIIDFYKRIRETKNQYGLYYPSTNDDNWLGDITTFFEFYSTEELIIEEIALYRGLYVIPFSVPDDEEEVEKIYMGDIFISEKLFDGREEEFYNEMVHKMVKASIKMIDAKIICLEFELSKFETFKKELKECEDKLVLVNNLDQEYENKTKK